MPTTEGYNGAYTGAQIDAGIAKANQAITVESGGELDMAESLGSGPYTIEFTEETSSGGSGGMTEEEADARYLKLAGGTLTGAVDMGGNAVTNLPAPVNDGDAARKADVENILGSVSVPSGVIVMWSGAADSVPSGWALCDGTSGTPDLRGRFVIGAGGSYEVGDTGGVEKVTLTTAQMPSHTHGIMQATLTGSQTGEGFNYGRAYYDSPVYENTTATGSGQAHENRPPYYALCYIMKL